jgi:hypothetical protein
MSLKIIVLISTLVMPSGDSSVHVKPYADTTSCIAAADIHAADPFVHMGEGAELDDGVLTLRFDRGAAAGGERIDRPSSGS